MKSQIGVIGMAVMGKNLALNFADHGYRVSIYNRTVSVSDEVIKENKEMNLVKASTLEELVSQLEQPRKIMIMVKAGNPVDQTIDALVPWLEQGDIIMDGGNSFYQDTIRRYTALKEKGIEFLGVGISGGEEGARFGPAIMPSGEKEVYAHVSNMLEDISAKAYGEPCVGYIGQDGSGHYVKMVHNGIEYGDMQLIAEAYDLLRKVGGLSNEKIQEIFETWNQGELDSYLIEITAKILKVKDKETGKHLVDVILDVARQKGTGKWTAQESLDLNIDASVLTSAVYGRFMSEMKEQRVEASKLFAASKPPMDCSEVTDLFIEQVRQALYASKLIAYAQGFDLLSKAAKSYGWTLDFEQIAKGWRGGCIIRAAFLNKIAQAYKENPQLKHLLFDPSFSQTIKDYQASLRQVVIAAMSNGVSTSAFANALAYFDGFTTEYSPANLIQAQRDFFGAHTFERVDKEGWFHEQW
ncbi:MAG TPA: phosphogluconate dehydrogenase (NADP(+)-dependent, decarboxylating) [Erysipelotrichaceae bacterium]|nr:phosphogluconate dehydrogenase (NADP(+)-dependent, decarboxylating) [Erysipelotrichaceae bacterium]